MENNFEKVKNYFSEEEFNRILEVMSLFGVSFPDNFDIYNKYRLDNRLAGKAYTKELQKDYYCHYAIVLSKPQENQDFNHLDEEALNELGYFEFMNEYKQLVVKKDGLCYKWARIGHGVHEGITITKTEEDNRDSELSVAFNLRDDGLISSDLTLYGTGYSSPSSTWRHVFLASPVIRSYVTNVVAEDRELKEEKVIEEYFDFFKSLLVNEHFSYTIPYSLRENSILSIIAKLFEYPINRLVSDLKSTDQTWRYEKEKKNVASTCKYEQEEAKAELDAAVAKAKRLYEYKVNKASEKQTSDLASLNQQEEAYKKTLSMLPVSTGPVRRRSKKNNKEENRK